MIRILLLIIVLLPAVLNAQFVRDPRKPKLNYNTTSMGVVNYGSGNPTYTPNSIYDTYVYVDTTINVMYIYQDNVWLKMSPIIQASAPSKTQTVTGNTIRSDLANWYRTGDSTIYAYSRTIDAWLPLFGIYYSPTTPVDGSGAIYTESFWRRNDTTFYYQGGSWYPLVPTQNIYNTSDTLTDNRVLYGDSKTLKFDDLTSFEISDGYTGIGMVPTSDYKLAVGGKGYFETGGYIQGGDDDSTQTLFVGTLDQSASSGVYPASTVSMFIQPSGNTEAGYDRRAFDSYIFVPIGESDSLGNLYGSVGSVIHSGNSPVDSIAGLYAYVEHDDGDQVLDFVTGIRGRVYGEYADTVRREAIYYGDLVAKAGYFDTIYGMRLDMSILNPAVAGTRYGIYLSEVTGAASSDWSLYSADTASVYLSGRTAIGYDNTIDPSTQLYVSKQVGDDISTGFGGYFYIEDNKTGTINYIVGLQADSYTEAGTIDYSAGGSFQAYGEGSVAERYGSFSMSSTTANSTVWGAGSYNLGKVLSGGNVDSLAGAYNEVLVEASSTATMAYGTYSLVNITTTGTIDSAFGVYSNIALTSDGQIGSGFGLYIADMPNGATHFTDSSWGVYVAGDERSYFGGEVRLGDTISGSATAILGIDADGDIVKAGDIASLGDGNGIISALPLGDVTINGDDNTLGIISTGIFGWASPTFDAQMGFSGTTGDFVAGWLGTNTMGRGIIYSRQGTGGIPSYMAFRMQLGGLDSYGLTIDSTKVLISGPLRFDSYPGSITGTLSKLLGVESDGDVIPVDASSLGLNIYNTSDTIEDLERTVYIQDRAYLSFLSEGNVDNALVDLTLNTRNDGSGVGAFMEASYNRFESSINLTASDTTDAIFSQFTITSDDTRNDNAPSSYRQAKIEGYNSEESSYLNLQLQNDGDALSGFTIDTVGVQHWVGTDSYRFPYELPPVDNGVKKAMVWTGDGSGTTSAFETFLFEYVDTSTYLNADPYIDDFEEEWYGEEGLIYDGGGYAKKDEGDNDRLILASPLTGIVAGDLLLIEFSYFDATEGGNPLDGTTPLYYDINLGTSSIETLLRNAPASGKISIVMRASSDDPDFHIQFRDVLGISVDSIFIRRLYGSFLTRPASFADSLSVINFGSTGLDISTSQGIRIFSSGIDEFVESPISLAVGDNIGVLFSTSQVYTYAAGEGSGSNMAIRVDEAALESYKRDITPFSAAPYDYTSIYDSYDPGGSANSVAAHVMSISRDTTNNGAIYGKSGVALAQTSSLQGKGGTASLYASWYQDGDESLRGASIGIGNGNVSEGADINIVYIDSSFVLIERTSTGYLYTMIEAAFMDDTAASTIKLYERYYLPNDEPSVVSGDTTIMAWVGNGTTADAIGFVPLPNTAGFVDGTGVANRIPYWQDANTLTTNAGMVFSAASQRITVGTGSTHILYLDNSNVEINEVATDESAQLTQGELTFSSGDNTYNAVHGGSGFLATSENSATISLTTVDDTKFSQIELRRSMDDDLSNTITTESLDNNAILGRIAFRGFYTPSNDTLGAAIKSVATQDWTTGATGAKLVFQTVANNSAALTDRVIVNNTDSVDIYGGVLIQREGITSDREHYLTFKTDDAANDMGGIASASYRTGTGTPAVWGYSADSTNSPLTLRALIPSSRNASTGDPMFAFQAAITNDLTDPNSGTFSEVNSRPIWALYRSLVGGTGSLVYQIAGDGSTVYKPNIGEEAPTATFDIQGSLRLRPFGSTPTGNLGEIYVNGIDSIPYYFDGISWVSLLGGGGGSYTFGSGLTESSGTVTLGGNMTQDVIITDGTNTYDFALVGIEQLSVTNLDQWLYVYENTSGFDGTYSNGGRTYHYGYSTQLDGQGYSFLYTYRTTGSGGDYVFALDSAGVFFGVNYTNQYYRLANTAPSYTANDTTFMVWIGTGGNATVGWVEKSEIGGGGAADGNGIIDDLPAGNVTISSANYLRIANSGDANDYIQQDYNDLRIIDSGGGSNTMSYQDLIIDLGDYTSTLNYIQLSFEDLVGSGGVGTYTTGYTGVSMNARVASTSLGPSVSLHAVSETLYPIISLTQSDDDDGDQVYNELNATSSGKTLGAIQWYGTLTGGGTEKSAEMKAVSTQAFGATDNGTELQFWITQNGSTTVETMTLEQDKSISILGYGSRTITGTEAYSLAVTSAGKIIETYTKGVVPNATESLQTSSITAVKGEITLVDCSAAVRTVNPPSSPSIGDRFAVSDAKASSATYNITVDFSTASQKTYGNSGSSANYILNTNGAYVEFVYVGSTTGWIATK